MKRISTFERFYYITEAEEAQTSGKYTELKSEIKSMIEKTIEKSGGEYKSFVGEFVKKPEDVKIEGFKKCLHS